MIAGRVWVLSAGLLGATGVGLGAYVAHGLADALAARGLEPEEIAVQLAACRTATQYQMLHAVALLATGLLSLLRPARTLLLVGTLMIAGTGLFSGGIYLHTFSGNMLHWAIVPAGGMAWILAWSLLAMFALTASPIEAGANHVAAAS